MICDVFESQLVLNISIFSIIVIIPFTSRKYCFNVERYLKTTIINIFMHLK